MTATIPANLDDTQLEPAVGRTFQVAFGLDDRPKTLAAWIRRTSDLLAEGFMEESNLARGSDPRSHVLHFDETVYQSDRFFEALVYPFAVTHAPAFYLVCQSPISDETVRIRSTGTTIDTTPEDLIVSFGVSEDIIAPDYFEVPPEIAYLRFISQCYCFPNKPAYRRWNTNAGDAVTMGLAISEFVGLVRSLTENWDREQMRILQYSDNF